MKTHSLDGKGELMRAKERKKGKGIRERWTCKSVQIFYHQWKNNLVSEAMDQEYPISFHDLVPYKGPGKLKQTPENLVNKSQD